MVSELGVGRFLARLRVSFVVIPPLFAKSEPRLIVIVIVLIRCLPHHVQVGHVRGVSRACPTLVKWYLQNLVYGPLSLLIGFELDALRACNTQFLKNFAFEESNI